MKTKDVQMQKELAARIVPELIMYGEYSIINVCCHYLGNYTVRVSKRAFGEFHYYEVDLSTWVDGVNNIGMKAVANAIIDDICESMTDDAIKSRILMKLGV